MKFIFFSYRLYKIMFTKILASNFISHNNIKLKFIYISLYKREVACTSLGHVLL